MALRTYTVRVGGAGRDGRLPPIGAFCRKGTRIRLKREPSNRHDANAIVVYAQCRVLRVLWSTWQPVGYIPAERAATWSTRIDRGQFRFVDGVVDSVQPSGEQGQPRLSLRVTFEIFTAEVSTQAPLTSRAPP